MTTDFFALFMDDSTTLIYTYFRTLALLGALTLARPSSGFLSAFEAIVGPGTVFHVDEAAPLDAVASEITALLHVLTPVTAEFIASAPELRLIQKLGVGVNTIALDAAREAGVAVCNMPGTTSQAVAEMALSLMMAVLSRTCFFDARPRPGEDRKST